MRVDSKRKNLVAPRLWAGRLPNLWAIFSEADLDVKR